MSERPISLRARQVADLERSVLVMLRHAEQQCQPVPASYEQWREHCAVVDVVIRLTLEEVRAVLPVALRPPVQRLIALRREVGDRALSIGRVEETP
jgi:hypothetical protein